MFNFINYLYNNSDLKFYKLEITFYSINRFIKKYNYLYIFLNRHFLYVIYYYYKSLYLKSVNIDI